VTSVRRFSWGFWVGATRYRVTRRNSDTARAYPGTAARRDSLATARFWFATKAGLSIGWVAAPAADDLRSSRPDADGRPLRDGRAGAPRPPRRPSARRPERSGCGGRPRRSLLADRRRGAETVGAEDPFVAEAVVSSATLGLAKLSSAAVATAGWWWGGTGIPRRPGRCPTIGHRCTGTGWASPDRPPVLRSSIAQPRMSNTTATAFVRSSSLGPWFGPSAGPSESRRSTATYARRPVSGKRLRAWRRDQARCATATT